MKRTVVLTALVLALLIYLTVSATSPSAPTYTVRFRMAHGLAAGDPVVEAATDIGNVTGVELRPDGGIDVQVRIDPRFRDRLRQSSTFVVTRLPGHTQPVLSLQVLDEDSPPLPPEGLLEGADSETELAVRREIVKAEKALRAATRQIENLQRTIEGVRNSKERKELETSLSGLLDALRRIQEEAEKIIAEELSKMKKWYEKPAS